MKNLGILIFFLASFLIIGFTVAKSLNQSKAPQKINLVKTTLSENTTPDHSHFHFKYSSPYSGEEDENEDEISGFKAVETSFFHCSRIFFDKNTYKKYQPFLDISDPYLNQIFTPPDFICS